VWGGCEQKLFCHDSPNRIPILNNTQDIKHKKDQELVLFGMGGGSVNVMSELYEENDS
jgi:hypothetical protein